MSTTEKQLRYSVDLHVRAAEGESRKVHGRAIVFNKESQDLGGFVEIIAPEAVTDELLRDSDVLCPLNHDTRRGILARSNKGEGSLKLTRNDEGVEYEFDAPHTALGDELLEGLRRGDISQSSFAFWVEDDEWIYREGAPVLHLVKKIRTLDDVSPVYRPAFLDTQVKNCRGLEECINKHNEEVKRAQQEADKAKAEEEARAKAELVEYYANIKKQYNAE